MISPLFICMVKVYQKKEQKAMILQILSKSILEELNSYELTFISYIVMIGSVQMTKLGG